MPKKVEDIKEEIQSFNDKSKFNLCIKQCYLIVSNVEKIQKVKIQNL